MSDVFVKAAGSQMDHVIDWSRNHLEEGEGIEADLGWCIYPTSDATRDLTVAVQGITGSTSHVTLEGGAPGQVYVVTAHAGTSTGRRVRQSFAITVSGDN
ncbi:hypothetical protein FHS89_002564 [Rubricella aquisinus]|uniref:Uncharacterized protein n=1 Tax=Rubricella aquisinus TaxID=2028108 RepID=A0A840WR63_9RHOB|nr:hypothetical protein [Rubricella aquisinus]MBB5516533.1 hypothetical protein [Rubricella aquisinus]